MSDTTPWQSPLSPGEPRSFGGGRYVVQRRLGAGNFATVYLAHDERLAVPVAVKLLSDRWSWEPEVRGRFVQEARLLRSLNDARVVQIRDIAETEDGRPYLVMDFATEGTLEQRMVELAQRQVQLGPDQLRVAAHAIATALAVLHERRIAHRDVKPSNMLITRAAGSTTTGQRAASTDGSILRAGERLMLGDLGLAKDLAFDSGVTVGVGTAGYMAPEQTLAGAKIDTRTDIFAASALLAQIASGEAPDPVRRVSAGTIEHGRPLPDVIAGSLRQVLLRGLDTNPDRRQQTIEQWLAEVDGALVSLAAEQPPPVASRRRRRAFAIAAVVLVGLIGVGLAVHASTDSPTTSSTSTDTSSLGFSVDLTGPTTVTLGKPAIWNVDAPGAVSGVWQLNGPVQPDPDTWTPGSWFEGTWNVQGTITLTLTVVDSKGNEASDSITFVVE